jgi:hypothetical protein
MPPGAAVFPDAAVIALDPSDWRLIKLDRRTRYKRSVEFSPMTATNRCEPFSK